MDKKILERLAEFGQSIWLDNINREMFESGRLLQLVEAGLRGQTSNPTIFQKAVAGSNVYDKQIRELAAEGRTSFEIYDELTMEDIREAADIFAPVYEKTKGLDGYISLEINPKLAFNAEETIREGIRLYAAVNRPNLMLKVPATEEGYRAIEELTASGININVTLIFALQQYEKTAAAFIEGIKRFKGSPQKIHSVASVFVSRIDSAVDKLLEEIMEKDESRAEKLKSLQGKAAVANARIIYRKFLDIFHSEEFEKLKARGANIQRPLWGSTSTKNPSYSEIKYIAELIAKDTVNTTPEKTLEAFMEKGSIEEALTSETADAGEVRRHLADAGVNIDEICERLLCEGVKAFVESFDSLLESIEEKTEI